jgi:hypothetical protein
MSIVLPPINRKLNYDILLTFARYVEEHRPDKACPVSVEVVEQEGMGKGLRSTRNIPCGSTVVWYGGPFVPISRNTGRTHSLQCIDPTKSAQQCASAIDGKIVSAAFSDDLVTDDERRALLIISGALMNSDIHDESEPPCRRSSDPELMWTSLEGVRFAAKRLVAVRDIVAGTDLFWNYVPSPDTPPLLAFNDMNPPPDQNAAPCRPKRPRISPIPLDPEAVRASLDEQTQARASKATTEVVSNNGSLPSLVALRV